MTKLGALRIQVRQSLGDFVLDVDISCESNPHFVVGPNGSGKTTLLRAVAGAFPDTAGMIAVGARILLDSKQGVFVKPEERRVGYLPQRHGLFPHLSVERNVAFGARGPGAAQRLGACLREHDCWDIRSRMPATLSGGESQRAAFARALFREPELLLLDEPFAAMDAGTRSRLRKGLADRLQRQGAPVLLATHDIRDILEFPNAVVSVLEQGELRQQGTLEALAARPRSPFLEEFLSVVGR